MQHKYGNDSFFEVSCIDTIKHGCVTCPKLRTHPDYFGALVPCNFTEQKIQHPVELRGTSGSLLSFYRNVD